MKDIKDLIAEIEAKGLKTVEEESTAELITNHSHFLGRLIPIRTERERESSKAGNLGMLLYLSSLY